MPASINSTSQQDTLPPTTIYTYSHKQMQFDFSTADWSDDSSPFDQCDGSFSSLDTQQQQQQRSPTAIRFSKDADEVFEIPHVSTFSDEQKTASWYQPQDYRFFRLQREHEAVSQASSDEKQKSQNDQS